MKDDFDKSRSSGGRATSSGRKKAYHKPQKAPSLGKDFRSQGGPQRITFGARKTSYCYIHKTSHSRADCPSNTDVEKSDG